MLALHLPPEKLFPQLVSVGDHQGAPDILSSLRGWPDPSLSLPQMPLVEPAVLSPNPYHRKAGLMCLAVLAEGCGDYIRNKYVL